MDRNMQNILFFIKPIFMVFYSLFDFRRSIKQKKSSKFLITLIILFWIVWIIFFVLSILPTKIGEGIGKFSPLDVYISEHAIVQIIVFVIGLIFALYIRVVPWGLLLHLFILFIENKANKKE
jgi:hypothetical protein